MSEIHLNIAKELRTKLLNIIGDLNLEQMWGFKYDSKLGKGINVHADFAKINLNFLIHFIYQFYQFYQQNKKNQ